MSGIVGDDWLVGKAIAQWIPKRPLPIPGRTLPCASQPRLFEANTIADMKSAQRICSTCPVQPECRQLAMDETRHIGGVWAGELYGKAPAA